MTGIDDETANTTSTEQLPDAASGAGVVANSVPEVPADPEAAFTAAFDGMTAPGEEPKEAPASVAEAAPPAEEPAPVEEPTPVEEEPPPAKLSDDEILARFADLVKNQPKQDAPPQQAAPQPQPEFYSPEEAEILKKYEEEWPDIAKAEAVRRSAEYKQLVGYVFQEVAKEFTPLVQQLNSLATRTHLSDLQAVVPDYADIRERVIDWANAPSQPTYLRAAYNHVIQQGTVDEVNDLITRFRAETGAVSQPAPTPRRAKPADLPAVAKQAAAALAPVSSKRSAVIQGIDPNDFDTAFESAASRRAN
jgi:hypothetical protein